MREVSPESIGAIILFIILIAFPIAVGIGVTKAFRLFRPIVKEESTGLTSIGENTGDNFFKMAAIGWLICGPLYYWAYLTGYLGQW